MIRVAVTGAGGRMGRMVLAALGEREEVATLTAAVERPGHDAVGREAAPGIVIGSDLDAALLLCDVVIDFTTPESTTATVAACAERGVAAIVGTTGLSDADRAALARAAERVPVVWGANYSVGVNLLATLVEQAARALGLDWDLEIVEAHHRGKRDAPSGTALALAEAGARGRDVKLREVARTMRSGDVGPRPRGEIGIVAQRGGDVVGEHTVTFFGDGERIELVHRATSRAIFARGAVGAALWAVGRPPGLYSPTDALDIGRG